MRSATRIQTGKRRGLNRGRLAVAMALLGGAMVLPLAVLTPAPAYAAVGFGSPVAVAGTEIIEDVACVPSTCIAVGRDTAGNGIVFTMTDGATSSDGGPIAITVVADTFGFKGITCTTATDCIAVGYGADNQGAIVPIEIDSGEAFPGPTTLVAGPDGLTFLEDIACPSPTTCYAVGSNGTSPFSAVGVLVSIDFGSPVAASVGTVGDTSFLNDIACPSADGCLAVGANGNFFFGSDGLLVPVAPGTGGAPATHGPVQTVPGAGNLEGIDCPSADFCQTVGSEFESGIVVAVDGGEPGDARVVSNSSGLFDVACADTTACLAVGPSSGSGVVVPVAGDTGDLVAQAVPGTEILAGVTCTTPSRCLAVGHGSNGGGVVVTVNPSATAVVVDVTGSQAFESSTPTFATSTSPPAGHTFTGTLTCTTVDDAGPISPNLPPGTYTIDGSSCSGLAVSGPNAGDYAIEYSGGTFTVAEKPQISVDDVIVAEGNAGATVATFTLHRSGHLDAASSVKFKTANGTATAASGDYVAVPTPTVVNFAPGATTATAEVSVTGDTRNEAHESFKLNLSAPANAVIVDSQAVGTITNDDGPGASLAVDDVAVDEGDAGTKPWAFIVSRSGPLDETSSVTATLVARTATAGADFSPLSPVTLTFAPGDAYKTVVFGVVGDFDDEPNESMGLNLASPVNATLADAAGTATIVDDDGDPGVFPSTTTLTVDDVSVLEGDSATTPMVFMVRRSGSLAATTTVTVTTADSTAVATSDYVALPRSTLTFAPGDAAKLVTVTVNGDGVGEGHDTLRLALSAVTGGVIADSVGVGTIVNDDGAGAQLGVSDVIVVEGPQGATTPAAFVLTRTGDATEEVKVTVDTKGVFTATAGVDYTALAPTVVVFDAGDTEATVAVEVIGDDEGEGDEKFNLRLIKPVRATIADTTGVATIRDDDAVTS